MQQLPIQRGSTIPHTQQQERWASILNPVLQNAAIAIIPQGVTTEKIQNQGVTNEKLGSSNYNVSQSSGTFSTSSGTPVQITNFSLNITTTGKPVAISFQSDGSGTGNYAAISSGTGGVAVFLVYNGTTLVAASVVQTGGATNYIAPGTYNVIDFSVDGKAQTYTYTAQVYVIGASNISVSYCVMVLKEVL